ncbi:MAG: hypothetical protein A3F68_03630 [Acidobacteria bacterium RIFCSPLOWO2_12_FULL_54_10]|nr:MAG: hypothetical protein A3F68_03630 [Acidobacteria bacterium RIFCSPLOWO2_12_FULL_54_10]
MKKQKMLISLSGLMLALVMAPGLWAQGEPQKCGGRDIATGPFIYASLLEGQLTTFTGDEGENGEGNFSVTAPIPNVDSEEIDNVFAGEGQDRCLVSAVAHIHIHEIVRIAVLSLDVNGDPVETPLDPAVTLIETDPMYVKIMDSFDFEPEEHTFSWLDESSLSVNVDVDILNPGAVEGEYGIYQVSMKAHAPGAGIGTGPGIVHTLKLYPPDNGQDIVPPNVSITKPAAQEILCTIAVEIRATDPQPGTGVETMSATVSSQGGSVSNQTITLAYLPAAAGFEVVATGSFTPWGGAAGSLPGTTLANAFDNDPNTFNSLSGIGNYRIDAQATDYAGNTGFAASIFSVLYDVRFDSPSVPAGCPTVNPRTGAVNFNSCTGMFQFSVHRSSITSDGAFMYDLTAVANLVQINDPNTDTDDVVVATHNYGTGSMNSDVHIDPNALKYLTHFRHNDLDENLIESGQQIPASLKAYRLDIYFMDEGGTLMFQASSPVVTF